MILLAQIGSVSAYTFDPDNGVTIDAILDYANSPTEVFIEIENQGTKPIAAIALANSGIFSAGDFFPGSSLFGVGKWAAGVMGKAEWDASRMTLQTALQSLIPGLEVAPFDEAFPGGFTRAAVYYAESLLPDTAKETIASLPWARVGNTALSTLQRLQPGESSGFLLPFGEASFSFYTNAFGPPLLNSTSKFIGLSNDFRILQGDTVEVIRNAPNPVPIPSGAILLAPALVGLRLLARARL